LTGTRQVLTARRGGKPSAEIPVPARRRVLLCLGTFGFLDELPEFRVLLEGLVFAGLDAGAEEEIVQGVLAQDAMDEDAGRMALKIDAATPLASLFRFRRNSVEIIPQGICRG